METQELNNEKSILDLENKMNHVKFKLNRKKKSKSRFKFLMSREDKGIEKLNSELKRYQLKIEKIRNKS